MEPLDQFEAQVGYLAQVVPEITEELPPIDGSLDRPLSSPTNMLPPVSDAIQLDGPVTTGLWLAAVPAAALTIVAAVVWWIA